MGDKQKGRSSLIFQGGINFWKSKASYLFFFLLIAISNFVIYPLFGLSEEGRLIIRLFFLFIIIAGTYAFKKFSVYFWLTVGFSVINLLHFFYMQNNIDRQAEITQDIFHIIFFVVFLTLLLTKVFSDYESVVNRLIGAVTGFLLIGNIFAISYHLLYLIYGQNVFSGAGDYEVKNLLYFSYTTLTTLGYGDILPLHPLARSLTNMEALIGMLYPAILITRLLTPEK